MQGDGGGGGGGVGVGVLEVEFSNQTTNQLQSYFEHFGSSVRGILNLTKFKIYLKRISSKYKPTTVLSFYLRAILRFLMYFFCLLNNFHSNSGRKRRQQVAETSPQTEVGRLSGAARFSYFSSEHASDVQSTLRIPTPSPIPDRNYFTTFRDYLLTAITFLIGHRSLVLRNLNITDVRGPPFRSSTAWTAGRKNVFVCPWLCHSIRLARLVGQWSHLCLLHSSGKWSAA